MSAYDIAYKDLTSADPGSYGHVLDNATGTATSSWANIAATVSIPGYSTDQKIAIVVFNRGSNDIAIAQSSDASPARYNVVQAGTARQLVIIADNSTPLKVKTL